MARATRNKTIAAIKRYRTRRLASLITKAYYLHRRKQDEKMYNLICEEFVSLGGVYVKFLQGVLLQSKMMRKWHNPEKLRIFENLDYEPMDIRNVLQHELSSEKLSQIASVQPQPFAAGTFGQVYYAQLRNGQPVIIKVLRPMIRETLKYDLRLLGTFSKTFFVKLYKNMNLNLDNALREFSDATLRETDYEHEAIFAAELHEAFKGHSQLIIPQTYLELCTPNIIVQDYVDGISVAQVARMHEQGVDPTNYVKETIGSDLITQLQIFGYESVLAIFRLPRMQGDPHPGNIRLLPDNRVGLIDFGISSRAPEDKSSLFGLLQTYDQIFKGSQSASKLFEQGLRFFVSDLYRSLKKLGDFLGKNQDRDYVNEVGEIATKMFSETTGSDVVGMDLRSDANILMVINKIVNKNNRFGLVVKLEASEVLRGLQTYTSMLSNLGVYEKVMPAVLDQSVKEIRRLYPEVAQDNKDSIGIGDAIEVISNWLERIADRDPLLFSQISEKIRVNRPATVPDLQPEGEQNG